MTTRNYKLDAGLPAIHVVIQDGYIAQPDPAHLVYLNSTDDAWLLETIRKGRQIAFIQGR